MLVVGDTLGVRFLFVELNNLPATKKLILMQTIAAKLITPFLPLVILSLTCASTVRAEQAVKEAPAKDKEVKTVETPLAQGALTAQIPAAWKQKKQRSSIIEREYAVGPAKGDENAGRLTMMVSGGSIKMNVDRWIGQFSQPDKKLTKDVAKVAEKKRDDMKVTIVDISGNYKESIGPPIRRQTVNREDYRMLGAIVQAKPFGSRAYFLKLYGPKKTMAEAEKPFMAMIESLKLK